MVEANRGHSLVQVDVEGSCEMGEGEHHPLASADTAPAESLTTQRGADPNSLGGWGETRGRHFGGLDPVPLGCSEQDPFLMMGMMMMVLFPKFF